VRQIVAVRRGTAAPATVGGAQRALTLVKDRQGNAQMALIARPDAAAAMIDSWMAYVRNHHPEMLQPGYWERLRRQRLASSVQLGIVPKATTQPGVEVDHTLPGWPAHGVLRANDRIVGVDGHRMDAANALNSLRELRAARDKPDRAMLQVVRGNQQMNLPIQKLVTPLDVQPIQPLTLLSNMADLLRVFSSASYVTWQPSGERVSARLELELAPGVPGTGTPKIMVIAPATSPASDTSTQPAQ
jgi:hypothetical protein